ncbi:non-hydrolyzing UDP-N-acetylglucosamine 2-epimerase [Brevibacterium luteolum]|uniref:non-hydrolyzing UDP-N-acetylglucosamine 2-epimerase n=1 Tax=Brevibacterium luteolum TaxID=199591 RepID=UPI0021AEED89|nr:UDP-N-acetylglucosamine 2-epimerase (non-hydrolyzing) [Brevibacterium luteolum]MCT1656923.1 UDP-N-acetylglucosamine 2-epimerase (non-hydrolyzing) [Brevibacterium luteolum]
MKAGRIPVMVVYGTRPEAIKLAPVIKALEDSPTLRPITLVTAQHREMLDQVNDTFRIFPDGDLDLMRPGQTLNQLSARIMQAIDSEIVRYKPAAVLVQGDTTTVMSAAIAAFNRSTPVIHLEAGLRSGNLASPFPEEGNRKLVSQIASLHLAPTEQARHNLLLEGISPQSIAVTGNTVIDALKWAVKQPMKFNNPLLKVLETTSRKMMLLTAHRRENLGRRMDEIGSAVAAIARRHPDLIIVWPAHRNPQVRSAIEPHIAGINNILAIEPVEYLEFAHLIRRSYLVLTDSGGLQEEAPTFGRPVLVLRENTERPEAVESGVARLVGTNASNIEAHVDRLLRDGAAYKEMSKAANPYGNGNAAARCLSAIYNLLSNQPLDVV